MEFAASFGITGMKFPDHLPNTRKILAVAEYARDQGKLTTFRHAAMNAYWKEGKNLEQSTVIAEIAQQSGLDPQTAIAVTESRDYLSRVLAMRREAEQADISGIPTFIIGSEKIFGCQPYEKLAEVVRRTIGK